MPPRRSLAAIGRPLERRRQPGDDRETTGRRFVWIRIDDKGKWSFSAEMDEQKQLGCDALMESLSGETG